MSSSDTSRPIYPMVNVSLTKHAYFVGLTDGFGVLLLLAQKELDHGIKAHNQAWRNGIY